MPCPLGCSHCKILKIKSRPHWLPLSSPRSSLCHVMLGHSFTGVSRLKYIVKTTPKTIAPHVKELERTYPHLCIMVMGDFNQLPLKLNSCYQVVETPTFKNTTLDKVFIRIKNAFKHCHQLSSLSGSNHSISKTKATRVTRRIYSDGNQDNLKAALDITIWDNLLYADDNINKQTEIVSDSTSTTLSMD